jgi:7-cyano-7-deazaguanine tRNA-ribosyltransferase
MLEVTIHDGPARLGKYQTLETPAVLKFNLERVVEDQPMPYDVPLELADWSVERTIAEAWKEEDREKIVVIHGSKYVDLRLRCAQELEDLGYHSFMVANPEELLKRPRNLCEMVVKIRKTLSPNSTLYFPWAELNFIPLLAYMGMDLFSDAVCGFYARLGVMLTPDGNYSLKEYSLYDMNYEKLLEYNLNSLDFVLREVREHIRNGTLRNLVEMRSTSTPEVMSALRILDRDYKNFIDQYTPLY